MEERIIKASSDGVREKGNRQGGDCVGRGIGVKLPSWERLLSCRHIAVSGPVGQSLAAVLARGFLKGKGRNPRGEKKGGRNAVDPGG